MIGPIGAVVTVSAASLLTLAASGGGAAPPDPAGAVAVSYVAPLPEPIQVIRDFDPPASRFGAGHLGVDLRAVAGERVAAASAGVVRFAGPVAGRGVVVIEHPDGIRTEYEPVAPLVHVGDPVHAGDPIGVVRGRHAGCAGSCLHWGARRGDSYLNPLELLRPLGPVVLLPDRQARPVQARG